MQREKFIGLLESPFQADKGVLHQVKEIAEEFPFFQTAQLLHAKLLKESHNIHFDNQLKISAAYAADRKQLFNLIEKKENINEATTTIKPEVEIQQEKSEIQVISEEKKSVPVELSSQEIIRQRLAKIEQKNNSKQENIIEEIKKEEKTSDTVLEIIPEAIYNIEDYFKEEIKEEPKPQIKFEPVQEIKEKEIIPETVAEKEPVKETSKGFSDHQNEKHSFLEWLSYGKPLIKKAAVPEKGIIEKEIEITQPLPTEEPKPPTDKIIEKFIKEEPRISPAKAAFFSPVNMARKSVEEHDDLVSPTLAQIYFLQGNPQKAIESYEKLILLYPEKSAFFAAQIEKIKRKAP